MHDALALANLLCAMPTRTIDDVSKAFEEYHKERYPNVMEAYDNSIMSSKMFNTDLTSTIKYSHSCLAYPSLSKSVNFRPQCGFLQIIGQKGTAAAELSPSQQKPELRLRSDRGLC
ncbi:MAG: hypothetical protein J3R72DRAFT_498343 [Linnemannia gamsii]|nr:MAG: hypothetical protein J3R72DRAFT_498343 [Linnemannia gamsii]